MEEMALVHRQTLDSHFSYTERTVEEMSECMVTNQQWDRFTGYNALDVSKSPDQTNGNHTASQP